jgi:hypothetical protein
MYDSSVHTMIAFPALSSAIAAAQLEMKFRLFPAATSAGRPLSFFSSYTKPCGVIQDLSVLYARLAPDPHGCRAAAFADTKVLLA